MQNFKIFSFILAIIVLIMVGQVVLSDYMPKWTSGDSLKTDVINKLGADLSPENSPDSPEITYYSNENNSELAPVASPITAIIEESKLPLLMDSPETIPVQSENNFLPNNSNGLLDFEDINVSISSINTYLRDEQLKSAGFLTAFFEEEDLDNILFKTIYVGDMPSVLSKKYIIRDEALLYAKVYIFSPDAGNDISTIYKTLKDKCSSNSVINETNQFGKGSFYMNDSLRADTAFLTVRYSDIVYAFSYPKIYHKQASNLIKLIGLEK